MSEQNDRNICGHVGAAIGTVVLVTAVIVGCGDRKPAQRTDELTVERAIEKQSEDGPLRFSVEAQGYFYGGYGDHEREIFIITDRQTGKQYLTITGAGVTELWTEEHVHTTVVGSDPPTIVTTTETVTVEE